MKHIFSALLVLMTGAASSFAQSMLKISLSDRRPITVSVDGRHFRKAGESITVNDLPRGRHYVMVYVAENMGEGRTGEGIIWEGKVKTYEGQVSLCTVDPRSREAAIVEQDMYNTQPNQPNDAQAYNNYNLNNYDTRSDNNYNNSNNNNNNYQQNTPAPQNNTPINTAPEAPDNNYTPVPDGSPVASPAPGSEEEPAAKPTKVAKTKTDKLKAKINAKTTDTYRLAAAKDVLKKESLSTAEVMSLMDCFSFESTKVEFAQWAYEKTTDKANFKKVKQKLTIKNYRTEMDEFLKNK